MAEVVRLSLSEVHFAATVGVRRQLANLHAGLKPKHGAGVTADWEKHVQGACGELVVAKLLGLYWDAGGKGIPMPGDVGPLEVRCTPYRTGCLVVYKEDTDNARFVLVTGYGLEYQVPGWLYAAQAKRQEWWRTERPDRSTGWAYFVPQEALRPIADLRAELQRECTAA